MRLGDLDEALRMIKDSKSDNPFVGNVTTRVWEMAHDSAISCVEATPTIDAVTVVRCKDCKHYSRPFNWPPEYPKGRCCLDVLERRVHPDDFCSYGERKDGGSNG